MEIRLSGHSAYRTEYHIVDIPKYRRRILNRGVRGYVRKLFPKIMRSILGCETVECNIQVDHIRMVMIIPPRYAVSEVVGKMKGMTATLLRKKFSWLAKVYWKENVYFVSLVRIGEREILKEVILRRVIAKAERSISSEYLAGAPWWE